MALSIEPIFKLPTQKKVLILVGILCVLAGLYVYLFFLPWQDTMNVAKGELGKLTKELNESKAITRDLQKFKEQVERLNGELKSALTQLPNEKEIPEILKSISSLGKESNLEFTLFKPRPEVPQQFYAQVPIELTALGNYHNIGKFFDKVSKLPRIINVVDFNMARVKGRSENEVLVKTSCMINTYRFIESKREEKKSDKKTASKDKDDAEFAKKPKK
jgi:type IV pilus assembly protein PilO